MNAWPMATDLANRVDPHVPSFLENDKQREHLEQAKNKELRRRRMRKTLPLFDLPLELRIQIYKHAVSDTEHNLTYYDWRKGGRLLPALLHTRLQITREIYRLCPITTVMDVYIPNRLHTLNQLNQVHQINHQPQRTQWLAIAFVRNFFDDCVAAFYAHSTVNRMLVANNAVKRFRSDKSRRGLAMKVRVTCRGCVEPCQWLSGGQQICAECHWFSRFLSWRNYNGAVRREDMLFEFC